MAHHALDVTLRAELAELHRDLADGGDRALQPREPRVGNAGALRAAHRGLDRVDQRTKRRAAARDHLATEEIEALDAARAFVERVELLIAQPRLGHVLARVAVAAMDLDGERVRLEALLGGKRLRDGGQQIEEQARALALVGRHGVLRDVLEARGLDDETQSSLHDGLLAEQHATDIGVLDDRNLRRLRALRAEGTALRPRLRVLERLLVRDGGSGDAVEADHDARLVHHLEHVGDAAMRLSHEPAVAVVLLAEVDGQARDAAPADLVDDARDVHVVGDERPGLSALCFASLRNGEQRHALDPRGRAFDAREREVDDVVREIVITGGDEDLRAAHQVVVPCARRLGDGLHVGEAAAGLRLGERHGAGPLARVHRRHEARAQVL